MFLVNESRLWEHDMEKRYFVAIFLDDALSVRSDVYRLLCIYRKLPLVYPRQTIGSVEGRLRYYTIDIYKRW